MTASDPGADDRAALLAAILPHVGFDGWTDRAIKAGAADIGLDEAAAARAFPGGAATLIEAFSAWADAEMEAALAGADLTRMKVRERIAFAIRARLTALSPYREAVRRAAAMLALPHHVARAVRINLRTADAIWWAIGDRSADFNYYTKRGLAAALGGAVLLYWLDDTSEDHEATWAFLDRRIADVLKIPAWQGRAARTLGALGALATPRRRQGWWMR